MIREWDPTHLGPLGSTENQFLQILLHEFALKGKKDGTRLSVRFDRRSNAIWRRDSKSHLKEQMEPLRELLDSVQQELDAVLLAPSKSRNSTASKRDYKFKNNNIVFRYGNGGCLPVIHTENNDYYCMNYRPIHPIGWNIANGGSNDLDELLNPDKTIERELREELIIVNREHGLRCLFEADAGKAVDHPDFTTAWKFWEERFKELKFPPLRSESVSITWIGGPDSLQIVFEGKKQPIVRDCFVNITTEDFGIEIDRVAKIKVPDNSILCFGEIYTGELVPGILGMFEVSRLNDAIGDGETEFYPDFFFFDAKRFDGEKLGEQIEAVFLASSDSVLTPREWTEYRKFRETGNPIGLCPISDRIIRRYKDLGKDGDESASSPKIAKPPAHPKRKVRDTRKFDAFISFGKDDLNTARKVEKFLVDECGLRVFFSGSELQFPRGDFTRAIDAALDEATWVIVVGTNRQTIERRWPTYEWRGRHLDIMTEKHGEGSLVSFITGMDPYDLPRPLLLQEQIWFEEDDFASKLETLKNYLGS